MKKFTRSCLALLLIVAMVLPNMVGIASAATKPSSDVIAEIPSGASIFFQSEDEAYSFNTASYWDVYQTQLGYHKGQHTIDTNHVNHGLILSSSTDAALVQTGASSSKVQWNNGDGANVSMTSSNWGSFDTNRVIEISGVTLAAGANDIKIALTNGADIRGLSIWKNGAQVEYLAPNTNNVNCQRVDNAANVKNATDTANGYIDVSSAASYKSAENCFGWMDNGYLVYHLAGSSADGIVGGEGYTLKLEYAGTNTSTNVKVSVNDPAYASSGSGSSSGNGGILRIDYESGWTYTYSQYATSGTANTVFDYTDGTATAVGWGGAIKPCVNGARDRAIISLRVVAGADLATLAKYMKLYLVDSGGNIKYQGTLEEMGNTSFGGNGTQGYEDFKRNFNPGFTTYVTPYDEKIKDAEGIKIIFEAPDGQPDISGTVEIGYFGLYTGTYNPGDNDYDNFMNKSNWTSMGPFNYNDAVIHQKTEWNAALNAYVKPFVRVPGNTTNQSFSGAKYTDPTTGTQYTKGADSDGNRDGTISGSNLSSAAWHLWTMSTSDANIVDASWADKNGTGSFNALEIKYQNNSTHKTTASLSRASDDTRNGQWLAITIKGEDLILDGKQDQDIGNINLVLNKNSRLTDAPQITVPLKDFRTAPSDSAGSVDMTQLNKGYQTLYYHVSNANPGQQDYKLYSVDFDFSGVNAQSGNDTHRIYVKEIYLYNPSLVIEKSVSKTNARPTEQVVYTLAVYNESNTRITNSTVSDTLQNGVSFVSWGQLQGTQNGQTLTWTIPSIEAHGRFSITFTASMPANAENGDMIHNSAKAVYNGTTVTSNTVTTTIEKSSTPVTPVNEFTFYAEVGQETHLPLGQATVTTTTTGAGSAFSTTHTPAATLTQSNWVGAGDNNWETYTISDVTFGKGANTVTFNRIGSDLKTVKITDSTGTTYAISPSATNVDGLKNFNDGQNGSIYTFTGNKSTDDYISVDGTTDYGPRFNKDSGGYIGYSDNGNLTFHFNNSAIAQGKGSITFEYTTGNAGASVNVTVAGTTYTSSTQNVTGNVIPVSENSDRAWIGQDGNLYYKHPNSAVKDTFSLTYKVNGAGDTQFTASVTVYNYQAATRLFVLDFGLPVSLTGEGDTTTEDIVSFAKLGDMLVSQGAGSGVGMTASFKGIIAQKSKKNSDGKADTADYNGNNYGTMSGDVVNNTYNGKVAIASDAAYRFTYEPTHFMDSADIFYYGVQVTVDATSGTLDSTNSTPVMEGQIKVIPANQVYYEDNFASSGTGADGDNGFIFDPDKETVTDGTNQTGSTQSNELGLQYGYDPEYMDDPMYSDGSATKLPGGAWAMFKFKGTGFDVVSQTATNTGTIMAFVYRASAVEIDTSTGTLKPTAQGAQFVAPIAVVSVDTYYENNGTTGLYQIPVISWTAANNEYGENEYGEYVVRIAVSETKVGNETLARPVVIDGIRIYNPGGTASNPVDGVYKEYTTENNGIPDETNLLYKELRELVLGENFVFNREEPEKSTGFDPKAALVKFVNDWREMLPGATVTENFSGAYFKGEGFETQPQYTADLLAYAVQGPNNELYISDGYGVALKVSSGDHVQVGVKAVAGSPVIEFVNANGVWTPLANLGTASEMYYRINLSDCYQNIVLLRVTGTDAIASFTNIKVDKNATISVPTSDMVDIKEIEDANEGADQMGLLVGDQGYSVIDGPGPNDRRTITFVTKTDVVDVQVFFGNQEAVTVTASYTFTSAGTKTWVIRAQTPENVSADEFTVYVVSTDGKRYAVPAAIN